jgi:hypothetical protein
MDANLLFAVIAAILMFGFSMVVLQKYMRRRQTHNFFWGVGLLMFAIGALAEGYLMLRWSEPLFRAWYVFGAMLNAGWLGHGSLTLLNRRPSIRYVTIGIIVLSLIGVLAVATITLNPSAYTAGVPLSEQYKQILPAGAPVRLLTPIFNIYGTIFLVGGAIYSAIQFRRKQMASNRVLGNLLIAAGALVIAAAGTLTRLFFGNYLAVSELLAAVLMFAGFTLASAPAPSIAPAPEQSAAKTI